MFCKVILVYEKVWTQMFCWLDQLQKSEVGNLHGVVVSMLDSDIIVSKFELQSH